MIVAQPARFRGDFWAVTSALTTGLGLIAAKAALETINPLTFNTYIFVLGTFVILIDAAISDTMNETIAVRPAQLLFLFIIAVFFCGSTLCLYTAVSLTEPATVSFLSRLELVATLILAGVFLKERVSPAESAGLILVIAGIIVMRYDASVELSRAVALVAASSLLSGIGEVLLKSRINWISWRSVVLYRNLFMAIIFLIAGFISGRISWVSDFRMLLLLVVAAILLPYMGRLSYLKAMRNIDISRASIISQSQPFFAAVAALVLLGSFPSLKEIIGGLLIVAGVIAIRLIEMRMSRSRITNSR
jgi:drug/metabolite transporter (DMT)-like permease